MPARISMATMLRILLPFAFGYFLSYFFRAVNAVVAPSLETELGLSAADLGLLTSAYLFTFALIQLPLGVALDRYGPRKVQTVLILIAASGAALFAFGQDIVQLTIARALIGLGFAGGLMAGFRAVATWLDPRRHALANSWVMSAGAVGLLVSTAPTEAAVEILGWREVFYVLSAVTVIAAVLIFLVVPERPNKTPAGESFMGQLKGLGRIMGDRVFWIVTPMLATTAGTQIAIQTLWAGPWQRDVAHLTRADGAQILFIAAVAFLIGVLFSGALATWLLRHGVSLLTTFMGFTVLFVISQVAILMELTEFNALIWFVFGMSGQTAVLAYPWLARYFGQHLAGRSNAAVNLSVFAAAFAIQYAIGQIIDLYPRSDDGSYPALAYRTAFAVFLAVQVVSVIWYVLNLGRIRAVERSFQEHERG